MTIRDQAVVILGNAEAALAGLAAEAGQQRSYDDAAVLLEMARRVQQIAEGAAARTALAPSADRSDPAGVQSAHPAKPLQASGRPVAGRRPRKADYPKFFTEGGLLVKVGWSKSEDSEYEHKCPKRVLDVLVAELTRMAGPGRRFVMDKVLPLRDPETGTEFPTYQPYLALAFLREAGLVEQHGRSGYSIPKPTSLAADADSAWGGIEAR